MGLKAAALLALLLLAACADRAESREPCAVVFAAGIPGPRGLAAAGGRVYVLDGTGGLRILDAAGAEVRRVEIVKTARGFPAGVSVDPAGRLLVADAHESRLLVLSPEGERLGQIGGEYGSRPGQFVYPQRIAFAGEEIFVSEYGFEPNNRVQVFASDGRFLRTFGTYGTRGAAFARPCGLAFGPDGLLYVADASHRVLRLTPEGRHRGDIGRPGRAPGDLDYPFGLAASPSHLFVAEYGTNRVSRFCYDGTFAGAYAPPPDSPAGLLHPRDVALDGGYLYVADTGHDRVVRLEASDRTFREAP